MNSPNEEKGPAAEKKQAASAPPKVEDIKVSIPAPGRVAAPKVKEGDITDASFQVTLRPEEPPAVSEVDDGEEKPVVVSRKTSKTPRVVPKPQVEGVIEIKDIVPPVTPKKTALEIRKDLLEKWRGALLQTQKEILENRGMWERKIGLSEITDLQNIEVAIHSSMDKIIFLNGTIVVAYIVQEKERPVVRVYAMIPSTCNVALTTLINESGIGAIFSPDSFIRPSAI